MGLLFMAVKEKEPVNPEVKNPEVPEVKEPEAPAKSYTDDEVAELLKKAQEDWTSKEEEKKRFEKLTEDEKKKELEEKYKQELLKKEKALTEKETLIALNDVLREEGVDQSVKDILNIGKYANSEDKAGAIREDVVKIKDLINSIANSQVEKFKEEFLKDKTPEVPKNSKPSGKFGSSSDFLNSLFK